MPGSELGFAWGWGGTGRREGCTFVNSSGRDLGAEEVSNS